MSTSEVVPLTPHCATEQERKVAGTNLARQRNANPAPALCVTAKDDGTLVVAVDHPDQRLGTRLLYEALGTSDTAFFGGIVSQILNATSHGGKRDQAALNFVISVIKGIEPRDQIEAMMAAQMAVVHAETMTMARRLKHAEFLPQQDSAERAR